MKKICMAAATAALFLAEAPRAALPYTVTLRNYFDAMTFNRPLHLAPYPGEDSAFVVLQQNGRIITVRRANNAWVKTDSAVISGLRAGTSGGDEQGLLGFAFHPNYNANGKYYLYYVTGTSGATRADHIVERVAGTSGRPATSDAQRTILSLSDPYDNHNGGTIGFDSEGFLMAGLGDGGSGGDPENRAQNKMDLLGKFIRLDVNGADAFPSDTARNYAIPATNPFKDSASYRPEIWAYGVRNPWKWSFHPVTGAVWAGDVGQEYREEVSRVAKGANMGWKIREGNTCYNPSNGGNPLSSCVSTGMTEPVLTVVRGKAQSITGGAFFTGNPASAYHGVYIYGDYVSDSVWAARIVNDSVTEQIRLGLVYNVSSFNRDAHGRVLAVSLSAASAVGANNGIVYVFESPDMQPGPTSLRHAARPFARPFSVTDYLRDPARFTVQGLDGREIRGAFTGTVMVREKGSNEPPRLMTLVW
jgi:glucose/arabinose dehydrogenase